MDKLKLTAVMLIWGSIGIFTRYIDLSPITLAFFRAVFAIPVLFIYIKMKKINIKVSFKKLWPYIVSGALLGFGWATLLYGYKNTDTSSAAIVYNMCPIYVMMAAPFILKERLSVMRVVIILISFTGLFFVVGGMNPEKQGMSGILLSGLSGMIYASIIVINRKVTHKLNGVVSAFFQITVAAVVLLPFAAAGNGLASAARLGVQGLLLTVTLGVVHTGLAYSLYFSSYRRLKSIDIVSYSYLEPVFCIVLGVVVLGEPFGMKQLIGGIMILGSTYIGEYLKYRKNLATKRLVGGAE